MSHMKPIPDPQSPETSESTPICRQVRSYRLLRDVRYRIIDNEGLVLRQNEAEILGLNETASRLLDLVAHETTSEALLRQMAAEYDVELPELERDIASFLDELVAHRVIEEIEG